MPNDALRLYVYCVGFDKNEMDDVYDTIERYGFSIYDSYDGFEGEVTYLTQAFSPKEAHIRIVDELEADLRDRYPDSAVDRDEKNVSQQAPGIEGVSYVTGITVDRTN